MDKERPGAIGSIAGIKVVTSKLLKENEALFISEIWSKKILEKFSAHLALNLDKALLAEMTAPDLIRLAAEKVKALEEEGLSEEMIQRGLENYMAGVMDGQRAASVTATETVQIRTRPDLSYGIKIYPGKPWTLLGTTS